MNRMRTCSGMWALLGLTIFCVPVQAQPSPDPAMPPSRRQAYRSSASKEPIELGLQPLSAKMPDIKLRAGLRPADVSQDVIDSREVPSTVFRGDEWLPIQYSWVASDLRHRPLYFEDVMLERHGQTRRPLVQPWASGARFFLTFPVLPYAMTVNPPCRAQSTLGHYRPGRIAPLLLQRPPLQADAGLVEAGTWVGLIFLIP
ncbi:MAG: hypothetical protein ACYC6N_20940 [Pirellulaceae bacterium]